jgi:hypothetical protein
MKNTITNLIAVVAVSLVSAAFAAGETESPAQPTAAMPAPAASAAAPATAVESTSAAPAEQPRPEAKRAPSRRATKVRPKDMDLRHCLDLDSNPAIARCAYE